MKTQTIGIGIIGMGWMGAAHARAYAAIPLRYADLPARARLVLCSDEAPAHAAAAQAQFGFERAETDWRRVLEHPQVDAVSITAPTHCHLEMLEAAAAAGKHIYCEKPAGRNAAETARAEAAARAAGVVSTVGYNYRYFPMVRHCRRLLDEGKIGAVEQFNGRFLTMYGGNPLSRLTWRFRNETAGAGAIGDILSHAIDMAHYLVGDIRRVTADRRTFIAERPLPAPATAAADATEQGTHFSLGAPDAPKGEVDNEDYAAALVEFAGGAVGVLEASRVARGPKCEMGFELYGQHGSTRWNFERMNELEVYLPDEARSGYTRLLAGEAQPEHGRFNPGDGIGLGYEDSKIMEAAAFLGDIAAASEQPQAHSGLAQALAVARVGEAVLKSCESGQWEAVAAA